jgi:DNA-binding XRE family transcriptional regulator
MHCSANLAAYHLVPPGLPASLLMTPTQCKAARALLGWSQTELAKNAGVGRSTVTNFELESLGVSEHVLTKLQLALEDARIQFTKGLRPGVRIR